MPQKTKFVPGDVIVVSAPPRWLKGAGKINPGTLGWVIESVRKLVTVACCGEDDVEPANYIFGHEDVFRIDYIDPKQEVKSNSTMCGCGDAVEIGYHNNRCRRCQAAADAVSEQDRLTREAMRQLEAA